MVPKDFKHVRPALEHLVALEVLERARQPSRRAKWFFKKTDKLGERVTIVGQQGNDVITKHSPLSGTISIAVTLTICANYASKLERLAEMVVMMIGKTAKDCVLG